MAKLVSKDLATEEINSWLDYKKVSDKKRESQKEQVESLIDAIADGSLTFKDDKTFTFVQVLKFQTEGDSPLTKLEYKPRLKMSTIHSHLQGVKSSDADGRICAYIAALTATPKALINSLDTEDYGIAQSIAIFFL